jgi:RNA polymerase sigma factor (sigma-70 family)
MRSAGVSDEVQLLDAAWAGDSAAFGQLVDPFRGEVQAHCYRMLGSLHDAEDAVQEALVRAWRGLDKFENRGSIRPWLYKIAANRCLTLLLETQRRTIRLAARNTPADGRHASLALPVQQWSVPAPAGGVVDPKKAIEQLCLPACTFQRHRRKPGGDGGAVVAADQVQAQVHACGGPDRSRQLYAEQLGLAVYREFSGGIVSS